MRYTQAHNALKPNGFEILLCCINPQPCDDDGFASGPWSHSGRELHLLRDRSAIVVEEG